jgi:hypothetical protein
MTTALAYRIILNTGLRRDELRQLCWGDVKLNTPLPCIQLRLETTKAKRADVLPLRKDLAALLGNARGNATDGERVCRTLPSMESHKRYLKKAKIPFEALQGRRVDFHALRHTYNTMLATAGVQPRVAMSLMRHSDIGLTMKGYIDPRIFDFAGAVEKLPALTTAPVLVVQSTGTGAGCSGRSKSVSSPSTGIGDCSAGIGGKAGDGNSTLSPGIGSDWQQKTPSGGDGEKERAKGVEPSTLGLESPRSAN